MKKILFLQNKGKSVGGVWFVNKTLGEQFIKLGYSVQIVSIRDNKVNIVQEYNKKMNVFTINEIDKWEVLTKKDLLKSIKKFKFFRTLYEYMLEKNKLKYDYKKLKKYILELNPDYIIVSHYQLLDAIPKKFRKSTIFVQHSSFEDVLKYKVCPRVIKKYNNLLGKICWLSKKTAQEAIKYGITNSTYIYNPIKFSSNDISNVVDNKTLVTISRIDSYQKRIDLMLKIVDKIFSNPKYSEWKFKLYGPGTLNEELKEIVEKNPQIELMGPIDNVKKALLSSSIYLSTSYMEGFSMSILEAYECGVPVVSYDFGESCSEQILNGKNGIVIPLYDEKAFIENLILLMDNNDKLREYSVNSKNFAIRFSADNIANEWIKLFKQVDDIKNE